MARPRTMGDAGRGLAGAAPPHAMTARVTGDALIAAAGLAVIGCASAPMPLDGPRVRSGIAIAPYALASECMALSRDDRVAYEFAARAPVDFVVSFREGN